MGQLVKEGLINRKQRRGTFVNDKKTEQAMLAILVAHNLMDEPKYFSRSLIKWISEEIQTTTEYTCRIYDKMDDLIALSDFKQDPLYRNLTNDLRNYHFKGIIQLVGGIAVLKNRIPELNIPTASLGPNKGETNDVMVDLHSFGYDCGKFIAQQGRKKAVYLRGYLREKSSSWEELPDTGGFLKASRDFGLQNVEIHQMAPPEKGVPYLEQSAYENTLVLIDQWQRSNQWPDALLLSDDIAARGITLALAQKNVDVPNRVLVVAMANEGIVHPYGIPVVRYEFSPRLVAKNMLEILQKRMCGGEVKDLPVKIAGNLREYTPIETSAANTGNRIADN